MYAPECAAQNKGRGDKHVPREHGRLPFGVAAARPGKRIVPLYDSAGIALYPVAERRKMGMRVLSNFCEEHIM